jgi:hypothetical protein
MASDLIPSSDRLVNQLGLQTDKNSNDLILTNPFRSSDYQYSDIDIVPSCEDAKTDI